MTTRLRAVITHGRSVTEMDQILAAVDIGDPLSLALYKRGECPNCACHEFNPGPRGGLAENVRCAGCGAKWWIGLPMSPKPLLGSPEWAFDQTVTFDMREYFRAVGEA
jgi:hypothetical protein